eukprot:TRINITY_DN3233_c0_g4_i1.p1 TRINITY_DN3233_c0_g4~~TRINITY_DN3233_c0_g4_i1.p1  ORF type:complete len:1092 (+),score=168.98 TRINITY_DN3233_c0_g4_i1:472-3276(+)
MIVTGSLLIGSPTCRLRNKVNITLHGSRTAQTLPTNEWVKGIYVTGTIDVHGALYTPTWTRLAKTAQINDTIIYIQDIVNWQPGQSLVITTTEWKDSRDWHRNEEKEIESVYLVSGNVAAIKLTTPLVYKHYGGTEYQAEVALLSRNIVIQGDEVNSEPADKYPEVCYDYVGDTNSTFPCENSYLTGFGGHVFITGYQTVGRFEGVELYRMGQTNQLARYPLHFHMVQTSQGPTQTLVSDCSVHRSFFRCYAIHGTNNVTLIQNTAYDAIAHCYFLEDGVEENNTFAYNFGAHVHPLGKYFEVSMGIGGQNFGSQGAAYYDDTPTLIHTSDLAAGVFYITNAYNTFIGNAASGGWTGFSFPNLPRPIKLHQNVTGFVPMNRPIKLFQGNSAHSTGYWWGSAAAIYVGGNLNEYVNPPHLRYTHGREVSRDTCLYSVPGGCPGYWQTSLLFQDTKVFLANRGMQDWGNREDVIRFEGHDLGLSANVFGSVWIDQMLLNCRSNNNITWWNGCPASPNKVPWGKCNSRDMAYFRGAVGFQFYDTSMRHIITNSIFRNCNKATFSQCVSCSFYSFELLTHSDQFLPDQMQATSNISYQNCDMNNLWHFTVGQTSWDSISGRLQNWLDNDGSAFQLVGTGSKTLLGSNRSNEWYKLNDKCVGTLDEMFICPLNPKDVVISITVHYDPAQEALIGSGYCGNGDKSNCTIVGSITHFGRSKGSGLKLGGNPKATGAMIYESGGWFVEILKGTPVNLKISNLMIPPSASALIAVPYPTGTTFSTLAVVAAPWCNKYQLCQVNLTAVSSVNEVRNGGGDLYYWDANGGILYFRMVQPPDEGNFKKFSRPWNRTEWSPASNFTRSGISLFYPTYGMSYQIVADCPGKSGLYCPYVNRPVPQALGCGTCGPSNDMNGNGNAATSMMGTQLVVLECLLVLVALVLF